MDLARIRDAAFLSVGRACMFALLGIWAATFGFITWPVTALRLAALLTTLTCVILAYKAIAAPSQPYRRTEVWAMLGKPRGIPDDRIQATISEVLRETFWRFASYAAALAFFLWLVAAGVWLARPGMVL